MPYTVRKDGKRWAIVNKHTGRVVGHSTSKSKAQSSANARNASDHGWKPSRRRG